MLSTRQLRVRFVSKASMVARRRRARAGGYLSRTRPTGLARLLVQDPRVVKRWADGLAGAAVIRERAWLRAHRRVA